jgi:outer membrane usher protein
VHVSKFKLSNTNPSQNRLNILLEHRGKNFIIFGEDFPPNKYSLDIYARYNQKLFDEIDANMSLKYQLGRGEYKDTHSINLSLSKYVRNGLGVNLNLSHNINNNGEDKQWVYVSLSWLKQLPF